MNILYHFRTRGVGAEGVHIAGVAEAFRELGHRVTFSSPTGVDPAKSAGSDPFVEGRGFWGRLARRAPNIVFETMELAYNCVALARNARLVRQDGIDAIYERHANFGCSTALVARYAGLPLIIEVNELVGDERVRAQPALSSLALATDRLIFGQADLIVVVSPHLKVRLVERGVDAGKIIVQPNAVVRREVETPANPATVLERHDLRGSLVVGFVGFFVEWHRLDWLLRAFAGLCDRSPQAQPKLLLVGEGPLKKQLLDQARSLGVSDRVVFTGAVPRDQIYSHIAAFDIAVIPFSNAFRSPIKLFEYMAQGRTVVAPATDPIRMVLRDGENGLLFEAQGADALEAALRRAIDQPGLRERCGRSAREQVLAMHTWTHNAQEIMRRLERPPAVATQGRS
jgi:glycosyltransferase involved in cell wall biosynthesis